MKFKKEHIRTIQKGLNLFNSAALKVDGHKGPNTLSACKKVNLIPAWWDDPKLLTGAIQYICDQCRVEGGPLDGQWGPQTEYGFDRIAAYFKTGEFPPKNREEFPASNPNNHWPDQTTEALNDFYGNVGENQVRANSPFPFLLAWNRDVTIESFKCHQKVQEPIEKALHKTLDHYGHEKIKSLRLNIFGGCLNVRKMRGGIQYSTHSWGIALDIDPENNKLEWGPDQAAMAGPEYEEWWKIWEELGATSLGRCKGYDFMHVQFANLNCK